MGSQRVGLDWVTFTFIIRVLCWSPCSDPLFFCHQTLLQQFTTPFPWPNHSQRPPLLQATFLQSFHRHRRLAITLWNPWAYKRLEWRLRLVLHTLCRATLQVEYAARYFRLSCLTHENFMSLSEACDHWTQSSPCLAPCLPPPVPVAVRQRSNVPGAQPRGPVTVVCPNIVSPAEWPGAVFAAYTLSWPEILPLPDLWLHRPTLWSQLLFLKIDYSFTFCIIDHPHY